jgi:hypothetical protein
MRTLLHDAHAPSYLARARAPHSFPADSLQLLWQSGCAGIPVAQSFTTTPRTKNIHFVDEVRVEGLFTVRLLARAQAAIESIAA